MVSSPRRASRDHLPKDCGRRRFRSIPQRLQILEIRRKTPESPPSVPMAPSPLRSKQQLQILLQHLHPIHLHSRSPPNPQPQHLRILQRLARHVRRNPKRIPLQSPHPIPLRLPPITTFPNSFTSRFVDGCSGAAITYPLGEAEYYFDLYSFISPSSTSSNIDGIVALVIQGIRQIHYWRPGDEAWTRIRCGFGDTNTSARAIAFREGKLYAIDYSENLAICKVGVDREATVIPSLKLPTVVSSYFHLVVSAQDILLFTCPWWEYLDYDCDCDARQLRFEYHKLEESEGTMRWKRLQGFDDRMVFLNEGAVVGGKLMPIISNAPAPGDKQKWLHHLVPPVIGGKNPEASQMDVRLIRDSPLVLSRGPLQAPDHMGPTWIVPKLY